MGATITTGKRAAAFRSGSGKVFYVLFEEHYEKNCYPHTPHWSAGVMGTIEDALEYIYGGSAETVGGMLQGRNGPIQPGNYIAAWLKELINPAEQRNFTLVLKPEGSCSGPIGIEHMGEVVQALSGIGREDLAGALAQGETPTISLYRDAEAFLALYGGYCHKKGVYPCYRGIKAVEVMPSGAIRDTSLGYKPQAVAETAAPVQPLPAMQYMKVDGDIRLQKNADGSWGCAGWEYQIVGNFVRDLYLRQLREPGSCKDAIKAITLAMETAPMISRQTTVEIDKVLCRKHEYWQERLLDEIREMCVVLSESENLLKVGMPADIRYAVNLARFPDGTTKWFVPEESAVPTQAAEQAQLALI